MSRYARLKIVKKRRNIMLGAIAAALMLALVAGLTLKSRSSLPDRSREAVQKSAASNDREQLPQFSAQLASGDAFSSDDIRTPAVIHVFASWCEVCKEEAPAIAKLQRQYGDVNFYFVAVEDTPALARAFMQDFAWLDAPLIDDPRREVEAALSLVGQPHTVFVGRDRLMTIHQGGSTFEDLDALAARIA